MTTSTDGQPHAAAAATETAAAEEWSDAFGDLDLDNDTHDTTATATLHQKPSPSATTLTAGSDKLNIVLPLWFVRTDEQAATEQFAHDNKTRLREILNFRVDRSATQSNPLRRFTYIPPCGHCTVTDRRLHGAVMCCRACWLYGIGRYQEAIDVITAPHPLHKPGKPFNSKESDSSLHSRCRALERRQSD